VNSFELPCQFMGYKIFVDISFKGLDIKLVWERTR